MDPGERLEELVLNVHRRNGGTLQSMDFSLPLLHPVFAIDSLDLAEIMVAVEREFGLSPFEAPIPPKTWMCIRNMVTEANQRAA